MEVKCQEAIFDGHHMKSESPSPIFLRWIRAIIHSNVFFSPWSFLLEKGQKQTSTYKLCREYKCLMPTTKEEVWLDQIKAV